MIFVHGNRVSPEAVIPEGRQVYQFLVGRSSECAARAFCDLVVAERTDSRPAAGRAGEGRTYRTGRLLPGMAADPPARESAGESAGIQFRSSDRDRGHAPGGRWRLAGRALPAHPLMSRNTRLVMIAGALHNTWLRPGGYHEQALTHLDHFLNLYNCCDPVLKRYHALYKHSHAVALGYAGMSTRDLGSMAERVEQIDACQYVAHSHEFLDYLHSSCLDERIRSVLFWSPASDNLASAQSRQVATDAAR